MSVIPITIFFSLLLAGGFALLFAREQRRRRFASAERDSLLPLADETPRLASLPPEPAHRHSPDHGHDHHAHEHDHDLDHAPDHGQPGHSHTHAKGRCGCIDGTRPPCAGCIRRAVATPLTVSSHSHT